MRSSRVAKWPHVLPEPDERSGTVGEWRIAFTIPKHAPFTESQLVNVVGAWDLHGGSVVWDPHREFHGWSSWALEDQPDLFSFISHAPARPALGGAEGDD